MAKFKKFTTKYLCMFSAFAMFFSALFYPLESFRADVIRDDGNKTTVTFDYNYSYSNFSVSNNSAIPLPPNDVHSDVLGESNEYTYFYVLTTPKKVVTTSSDYYAYKLALINNSGIPVRTNIRSINAYFATDGYWYNLKGLVGEYYYLNSNGTYWYVTDFADGQGLFFAHLILMYEYNYVDTNYGTFNTTYPSVSYNGNITVSAVPYTIDDLTDEIYATLQNIYSTNTSMLTKLNQIYSSVDSVESKLQDLVDIAEDIETNTDELEGLLRTCNSYLASIKTELEEQTTLLERIWNTLVDYFDTSNSQQDKVDDFANNSNQQSGSLDNLVGDMNDLEKPSVNGSANDIDVFIPSNDSFIIRALDVFLGFDIVTTGLVCCMSMAFVAYVLFGKR